MSDALVELRDVFKRYDDRGQLATTDILAGVDLDVAAGESVAIVGPSGCGKSTLLNIIGGLLPPTRGTVRFAGDDLTALGADALAELRNRSIGFVFQSHHLLPQCTALENALIPTLVYNGPLREHAEERARALLDDVGLGERVGHRPAQLSGGECQRVAVVRALINQPRLVLADEPTGSLDARASEHLADLLCSLNERQGVALVTVTHSESLAARMQRGLELRDGRLATAPVQG